jgi:hypothetical protein
VVLWLTRYAAVRFPPGRIQDAYARLHAAIFGALRRPTLALGSVLVGVLAVDPVVAGSIVLLDRVVSYWALLAVPWSRFRPWLEHSR